MEITVRNGKTYLRGIAFEDIARQFGTPFYLYDLNTIYETIQTIRENFGDLIKLYYAMKANPNLELLKAIRGKVDGLDISSYGEMEQSLLAGYAPQQLSFAGPGKTSQELDHAITNGIGTISVESIRELEEICGISRNLNTKVNIALRINPGLLIKEFAIKMGGMPTQFGVDEEEIGPALQFIKENLASINFLGIHVYSGTQCMSEDSIVQNIANILQIAKRIEFDHQMDLRSINLGGGFGISLYDHQRLDLLRLCEGITKVLGQYKQGAKSDPVFIIELGRYLTTEAGIYLAKVLRIKKSRGKIFAILDGGMHHHLAASGNFGMALRKNYPVENLSNPQAEKVICQIVGPLCTTLDLMGKDILIENPREGDLLAFVNSGSYAYSASPLLFLGHQSPPELLLDSNGIRLIRPRKKIQDWN